MVRKEVVAPPEPEAMRAFYERALKELVDALPFFACRECPANGVTCRDSDDECPDGLIEYAKRRADAWPSQK